MLVFISNLIKIKIKMKKQINKIKRMQRLAGLIKEGFQNSFYAPEYLEQKYGKENAKKIEAEIDEMDPNSRDRFTGMESAKEVEEYIADIKDMLNINESQLNEGGYKFNDANEDLAQKIEAAIKPSIEGSLKKAMTDIATKNPEFKGAAEYGLAVGLIAYKIVMDSLKESQPQQESISSVVNEALNKENFEPDYSPGEYLSDKLTKALEEFISSMPSEDPEQIKADVEYEVNKTVEKIIQRLGKKPAAQPQQESISSVVNEALKKFRKEK